MNQSRAVPRCLSRVHRAGKASIAQRRFIQTPSKVHEARAGIASRNSQSGRHVVLLLSVAIGAGYLLYPRNVYAEAGPAPAGIKFEAQKPKAFSEEENRDLISSQHLQVKRSWENPGVYAWSVIFSYQQIHS